MLSALNDISQICLHIKKISKKYRTLRSEEEQASAISNSTHWKLFSNFYLSEAVNLKKSFGKVITKDELFCEISFIELGEKRLQVCHHHQK